MKYMGHCTIYVEALLYSHWYTINENYFAHKITHLKPLSVSHVQNLWIACGNYIQDFQHYSISSEVDIDIILLFFPKKYSSF